MWLLWELHPHMPYKYPSHHFILTSLLTYQAKDYFIYKQLCNRILVKIIVIFQLFVRFVYLTIHYEFCTAQQKTTKIIIQKVDFYIQKGIFIFMQIFLLIILVRTSPQIRVLFEQKFKKLNKHKVRIPIVYIILYDIVIYLFYFIIRIYHHPLNSPLNTQQGNLYFYQTIYLLADQTLNKTLNNHKKRVEIMNQYNICSI
eukprot:TRINITY_DN3503_c0_g1_i2.p1 TRINITY_DN3503_c0_g1~~TRINITY_DN3503_c0_g1_i2.p1  ORF type:complete len:208 (+),score=-27.95 TRINITY_DN3503_c0_g1_i2:27-626(+)